MRTSALVFMLLFAASLGCDQGASTPQPQQAAATPQAAPVQPPVAAPPAQVQPQTSSPDTTTQSSASQTSNPQPGSPDQPPPGMVREKAAAGAGKQGRGYGGGIITEPVRAYWNARQKVDYEIKVPGAMRLFKAQYDRNPTDAEFQQMLKDNDVNLPTLPEGERYVYDAKTGELMVERPAPAQ